MEPSGPVAIVTTLSRDSEVAAPEIILYVDYENVRKRQDKLFMNMEKLA